MASSTRGLRAQGERELEEHNNTGTTTERAGGEAQRSECMQSADQTSWRHGHKESREFAMSAFRVISG
jgi:hypothetical protein